jgi:hypothetical protein
MPRKSMLIGAAAAILAVNVALVVVASAAHGSSSTPQDSAVGQLGTQSSAVPPTATLDITNGVTNGATGGAAGSSIATIYPVQPGPFQPGYPPFAQTGVAGDGLTAWGVAYKPVSDPAAEPDAALMKAAFDDGQKRAQSLAAALGLKLGSLAGVSDYALNQPSYNGCIEPLRGGAVSPQAPSGKSTPAPVPQTTAEPAPPSIAQPMPPCQVQHYVVAWVLVRYHF